MKKLPRKLLPILLPILFIFSTLACVLPISPIPVPTQLPTVQITQTQLPTQLPTVKNTSECDGLKASATTGKVIASPEGGLNIRNLPLEMGGIILKTVPDGTILEIYQDFGNGWSQIRLYDNGEYICGFVKIKYVQIK